MPPGMMMGNPNVSRARQRPAESRARSTEDSSMLPVRPLDDELKAQDWRFKLQFSVQLDAPDIARTKEGVVVRNTEFPAEPLGKALPAEPTMLADAKEPTP